MAKNEVRQSDITVRGDPSSRLYNVASSSSDSSYTVDGAEESCTCTAWAMGRNRAVRDGLGAHFRCKHVTAVLMFEHNAPVAQRSAEVKAAQTQKEVEAATAAEFDRLRRVARLKKDLQDLKEDM